VPSTRRKSIEITGNSAKKVILGRGRQSDGLAKDLQALGFSDYEARAYIALLEFSPATAYEISKVAGLPRANTYGALESCTQKGAVQPLSQNPIRYVPVEPQELLSRIASDTSTRCSQLASRLTKLRTDDCRQLVWIIQGEKKVNAKIAEMINESRVHVWIKAHENVIETHKVALQEASDRGVRILIILFGLDSSLFQFNDNVRIYLHEGNGVRVGNADNLLTIATDFKTALTANMLGEVNAAFTRNEQIVTMAETLIRHDMYMAEIFNRFGPLIDDAFGPYLLSLRRKYFSQNQLSELNQTLDQNLACLKSASV